MKAAERALLGWRPVGLVLGRTGAKFRYSIHSPYYMGDGSGLQGMIRSQSSHSRTYIRHS